MNKQKKSHLANKFNHIEVQIENRNIENAIQKKKTIKNFDSKKSWRRLYLKTKFYYLDYLYNPTKNNSAKLAENFNRLFRQFDQFVSNNLIQLQKEDAYHQEKQNFLKKNEQKDKIKLQINQFIKIGECNIHIELKKLKFDFSKESKFFYQYLENCNLAFKIIFEDRQPNLIRLESTLSDTCFKSIFTIKLNDFDYSQFKTFNNSFSKVLETCYPSHVLNPEFSLSQSINTTESEITILVNGSYEMLFEEIRNAKIRNELIAQNDKLTPL